RLCVQLSHRYGSYVAYRQASPALAYPLACCRIMDLQRLSDVLQSLHLVLQTDNVHAHRLIQIILKKMDESLIHSALALRLTRFPLATCQVLKMESCEDQALHLTRDHSPVQAWHWKYHPHPHHVQIRSGYDLPCASTYQSLL